MQLRGRANVIASRCRYGGGEAAPPRFRTDSSNSTNKATTPPMHSSTDVPLDHGFPAPVRRTEALVQDRPTLGTMPRAQRGIGWWLLPVVDLISSSVALTAVALASGAGVFPALPLAPLLLVIVYGVLGVYGAQPDNGCPRATGMAWPVIRLLVAALFAWSASLLIGLDGGAQLMLWVGFVVLDTIGRWLQHPARPAPRSRRALGPGRRRGNRGAAQGLRATARVRDRRRDRAPRRRRLTGRPTASPRWKSSTATTPTAS